MAQAILLELLYSLSNFYCNVDLITLYCYTSILMHDIESEVKVFYVKNHVEVYTWHTALYIWYYTP